jgi:galactokinase
MNYELLYGKNYDENFQTARRNALIEKFTKAEGGAPAFLFSSSGRAEILGNHTDHQHGKVVVSAISCDILAAVSPTAKRQVKICSEGYRDIVVNLSDLTVKEREYGTSTALTRGVLADITKRFGEIKGGFTAHITSNVFKGAGVSSSAAFELLVAEITNDLYFNGNISAVEKAAISQFSENVYFNKPCGILDQMGISLGGLTNLDFAIPEKPVIQSLKAPEGYAFVITNTGGDHAHLTSHYADIKTEMKQICEYFNASVLREVEESAFYAEMPKLIQKFPARAILRAKHIFDENAVVDRAVIALNSGNGQAFLQCVADSGESSLTQLQNNFVPGEKVQPIPLALKLSQKYLGSHGAVRVHGGGFAGTVLAVVETEKAEGYMAYMKSLFGEENCFLAKVREKGACRIV